MSSQKKKGMNLERKQNFTGWVFLLPATILIAWMSFYPMIQAFILSLQTGMGINLKFNGFANYARILKRSEERRVGKECRSRWSPYH